MINAQSNFIYFQVYFKYSSIVQSENYTTFLGPMEALQIVKSNKYMTHAQEIICYNLVLKPIISKVYEGMRKGEMHQIKLLKVEQGQRWNNRLLRWHWKGDVDVCVKVCYPPPSGYKSMCGAEMWQADSGVYIGTIKLSIVIVFSSLL